MILKKKEQEEKRNEREQDCGGEQVGKETQSE